MQAHKTETTVNENGTIVLTDVPFRAGQRVEIIVLSETPQSGVGGPSPLRGTVLQYENPFEPVGEDDWEANE